GSASTAGTGRTRARTRWWCGCAWRGFMNSSPARAGRRSRNSARRAPAGGPRGSTFRPNCVRLMPAMSRRRTPWIVMGVVGLISAALGALFFLPLLTYRQERSPDGWFTVTAKTRLFDSIIAVMPGQGGDKPGRVTLFGADGRFCGAARLPMVNLIYDLRW